jgi:hypothetical protein
VGRLEGRKSAREREQARRRGRSKLLIQDRIQCLADVSSRLLRYYPGI